MGTVRDLVQLFGAVYAFVILIRNSDAFSAAASSAPGFMFFLGFSVGAAFGAALINLFVRYRTGKETADILTEYMKAQRVKKTLDSDS